MRDYGGLAPWLMADGDPECQTMILPPLELTLSGWQCSLSHVHAFPGNENEHIKQFPHRPMLAANVAYCARSLIVGVHAIASHQWSLPKLAAVANLSFPSLA